MKKLKSLIVLSVLILPFILCNMSFGYTAGASYTWDATQPGYNASATLHTGTIDTTLWSIMGDFVGRSATAPNALSCGDSGAAVSWDDDWTGGGNLNTNGDALDGLWVQIYSDGGWWDMGQSVNKIAVSTSQDHGPYLGEGLEYRVY